MLRIALIIAVAVAVVVGLTRLTVRNSEPAAVVDTPAETLPEPALVEPVDDTPALDVYEDAAVPSAEETTQPAAEDAIDEPVEGAEAAVDLPVETPSPPTGEDATDAAATPENPAAAQPN